MNLSKRVIILDKINSPAIAQAIFILKDGAECEFSAVAEAERIVAEFMEDKIVLRKKRNFWPILIAGACVIGLLVAFASIM